jgi:hypothetical protein
MAIADEAIGLRSRRTDLTACEWPPTRTGKAQRNRPVARPRHRRAGGCLRVTPTSGLPTWQYDGLSREVRLNACGRKRRGGRSAKSSGLAELPSWAARRRCPALGCRSPLPSQSASRRALRAQRLLAAAARQANHRLDGRPEASLGGRSSEWSRACGPPIEMKVAVAAARAGRPPWRGQPARVRERHAPVG